MFTKCMCANTGVTHSMYFYHSKSTSRDGYRNEETAAHVQTRAELLSKCSDMFSLELVLKL